MQPKSHARNQADSVAANVEDKTVAYQIRRRIIPPQVVVILPVGLAYHAMPSKQCVFRSRMLLRVVPQRSLGDNSHGYAHEILVHIMRTFKVAFSLGPPLTA